MYKITVFVFTCAIVLVDQCLAIKVIESTSNSLHWDLKDVLESGKRYLFEVLLKVPTGDVLITDGILRSGDTTYTAYSLRSNKPYQLLLYETNDSGTRKEVASILSYTNIVCYTCNGAPSAEECTTMRECPASHRQCFTQVRYYNNNGRDRFYFFKGCLPPTDKCSPNKKRVEIMQYANSVTGDLTTEEVLQVMPGLKFFGDIEGLIKKSKSIMQRAKDLHQRKKDSAIEDAIKEECARGKEDATDFCRCCCSGERCNHAMLDCGMTDPPEIIKTEPLPPDIATPPPETTFPVLAPTEPPPACKDFNGGCDHICTAVNRTVARCKCLKNYKLQSDGKTCTTHLKHAVADAGPDISVTLPVSSVIISAKDTKGAVKTYKWWSPISVTKGGGLTTSDPHQRDLTVTNLITGEYRFVLMVTGQDGRRTSDTMTLKVLPNGFNTTDTGQRRHIPRSVKTTSPPRRTRRPRVRLLSFNRFPSSKLRREWQSSGNRYRDKATPTPETPKPSPSKLTFRVIPGVGGNRRPPTTATSTKPAATTPTTTTTQTTTTPTPTTTSTTTTKAKTTTMKTITTPTPTTASTTTTKLTTTSMKPTTTPIPTTTSTTTTTTTKTTTTATTTPTTAVPTTTTTLTTTPDPVVCPLLDELEEREVKATCTNSNFKGSQCEFRCEGKRKLQGGPNFASCEEIAGSGQWRSELKRFARPCCQLPCPANAYGDIIFLIDSSTKIGRSTWLRILRLANSALNDFAFGPGGVCVGAVRYNRVVDVRSEIPLDCSRSKEDFEKRLLRLSYLGGGTNTVAGLNHLRTKSFATSANRRNAQDVAIVITDSKSTGKVAPAADALKAKNVKVVVIGIKTPAGTPNRAEMRRIASTPKGAIYLPRIPGKIPPAVTNQIRFLICDRRCKRFA